MAICFNTNSPYSSNSLSTKNTPLQAVSTTNSTNLVDLTQKNRHTSKPI